MRLYLFRQWCYFLQEVPLCLTGTVSKILLAFLHGHAPAKVDAVALHRRRVEHGHLSVGPKSTVWATGVSSLLWWKVLAERKKFSMSTTTHSHASLCLVLPPVGSARSAILLLECIEHFIDLRFSVTRKSRSRYALQGDLALVVRHCWR